MNSGKRLATIVAAVVVAMMPAAAVAQDAWPVPSRSRVERSSGLRTTGQRLCGVSIQRTNAIARQGETGVTVYRIVSLTLHMDLQCGRSGKTFPLSDWEKER